jgi:MFS family permease
MIEENAACASAAPPAAPWRDARFMAFFLVGGLSPLISIALRFVPGHLEVAGHSPALIGEVMATSTLGGLVAFPLAGWLSHRHLRAVLVGGAAIQALGLALASLSSSSPAAIAASIGLLSVGTAHLDVGVLAGLMALTPPFYRSRLLAYYFAYISLARNVLGSALAEGVMSEWGFAAMCQVLAGIAAVHLLIRAVSAAPAPAERAAAATRVEFFRDMSRPRVLTLLCVFVLLAVHFSAEESFLTALAARRALGGVTPFFIAYFGVLYVGRTTCSHLIERLGRGAVTIVSAVILALVGGGLAEVRDSTGLIILGACTGLGHLLLWPALYATFYDRVRGHGMVSAALSMSLAMAELVAELGLGELASYAGYRALYWGAAVAALAAALLALPLARWMSHVPEPAPAEDTEASRRCAES